MEGTVNVSNNKLFDMISKMKLDDKLLLIQKLEKETIKERLEKLRNNISNPTDINESDVMKEIANIRYNK